MSTKPLSDETRARLAEAGRRGALARYGTRADVPPDPPADPAAELAQARQAVQELRDRSGELRSRIHAAEEAIRAAKPRGRDVTALHTEIKDCRQALGAARKPEIRASERLRSLLDRERERRERPGREERERTGRRRRQITERMG